MNSRYDDAIILEPASSDSDTLSPDAKNSKHPRKLDLPPDERMDNRVAGILNFDVVHDGLLHSYKSYQVMSKKTAEGNEAADQVTVHRRFSDFEWLYMQLIEKYPCCVVPSLPEKNMLANFNQENLEFIEERKMRLTSFLNKILKHRHLRYAPEFHNLVVMYQEFHRMIELGNRKSSGLIATVSTIVEYMPSVPGLGYISGFISGFSGLQKVRRERTSLDDELEKYAKEIENLHLIVEELARHLGLLAQVEREQANTMIDISTNLAEIDKLGKSQGMKEAKLAMKAADKGSDVQKVHAKFLHNSLEREVQDTLSLIIAAKEALKRRVQITEAVEESQAKLDDLKRNQPNNSQIYQLKALNDDNKEKLALVDEILPHEIEDFKRTITGEIEQIAKEFIKLQIEYSGKMVEIWDAK